MDADRLVDALRTPQTGWDRAKSWLGNQFSLDTPEQDLVSPETAGDMALGFIPGVGQAMAVRDIARGVKAGDPVQTGLAAASLIPFGNLVKSLRGPVQELIAGRAAWNAPQKAIAAAENFAKEGASTQETWGKYGAYKGPEGAMKWEISDQPAKLLDPQFVKGGDQVWEGRLGDVVHHPEAYANYPELADLKVRAQMTPGERVSGWYHPNEGISAVGSTPDDILSTILHEMQHGIQNVEGFDPGANRKLIVKALRKPFEQAGVYGTTEQKMMEKQATDYYNRSMGEAEARAVEERWRAGRLGQDVTGDVPLYNYDVPYNRLLRESDLPGYKGP